MKNLLSLLIFASLACGQSTTIGTPIYMPAGAAGLSDATSGGRFAGTSPNAYYDVTIAAAATPDTFTWIKNGGAASSPVAVTGAAQVNADGVSITFAATTGHTVGDKWRIIVSANGSARAQTFAQDAFGAVVRPDQAKAREHPSVADFQADDTGHVDISGPLNNISTWAQGFPQGLMVEVPRGQYLLSSGYTVPEGVTLVFLQGACLINDAVMDVQGSIENPSNSTIFCGNTAPTFHTNHMKEFDPKWFGLKPNGSTPAEAMTAEGLFSAAARAAGEAYPKLGLRMTTGNYYGDFVASFSSGGALCDTSHQCQGPAYIKGVDGNYPTLVNFHPRTPGAYAFSAQSLAYFTIQGVSFDGRGIGKCADLSWKFGGPSTANHYTELFCDNAFGIGMNFDEANDAEIHNITSRTTYAANFGACQLNTTLATINTAADTITTAAGTWSNGDAVLLYILSGTGAMPAPIRAYSIFVVANASGSTFQLARKMGGGALDLTAAATGSAVIGVSRGCGSDTQAAFSFMGAGGQYQQISGLKTGGVGGGAGYVRIDAQNAAIRDSYLPGSLQIGDTSRNHIGLDNVQVEANTTTGVAVECTGRVTCYGLDINHSDITPSGLTYGSWSIFAGPFVGGAHITNSRINATGGQVFGDVSTTAGGYYPRFTFDHVHFELWPNFGANTDGVHGWCASIIDSWHPSDGTIQNFESCPKPLNVGALTADTVTAGTSVTSPLLELKAPLSSSALMNFYGDTTLYWQILRQATDASWVLYNNTTHRASITIDHTNDNTAFGGSIFAPNATITRNGAATAVLHVDGGNYQSCLYLDNSGASKWQLCKNTTGGSENFFLWNGSLSNAPLTVDAVTNAVSMLGTLNIGGAYQVGGSTVIDSSRNATVANLTVTGTCTGCASLPQALGTTASPTFAALSLVPGSGSAVWTMKGFGATDSAYASYWQGGAEKWRSGLLYDGSYGFINAGTSQTPLSINPSTDTVTLRSLLLVNPLADGNLPNVGPGAITYDCGTLALRKLQVDAKGRVVSIVCN